MGIPKYELNRRPVNVAADQEFDPQSSNAMSGVAVSQAINEAFEGLAPEYSATAAYLPGDLVLHNGSIYSALVTIAAPGEEWTPAHWDLVNLNDFVQKDYITLVVNTTYANLVTLRNQNGLVAGRWYRITDYECTTSDSTTQSAGHLFDILVRADDKSHLNENAYAVHHNGDTYFQNCKLEDWQLKYSLDNDASRFAWADSVNGKGVIWWMRDEWGNECWYDFKNILFRRFEITACPKSTGLIGKYTSLRNGNAYMSVDGNNPFFVYTFCMIDKKNGGVHDVSVEQELYPNDEQSYNLSHDNVFKPFYKSFEDANENLIESIVLPNNVFVTDTTISGSGFFGFHNNTFGESSGNTFGNGCIYNTFEDGCVDNTAGNDFFGNVVGCDFAENVIGDNCSKNRFSNNCQNNITESGFGRNSIGNNFKENQTGQSFSMNTIGERCTNNEFAEEVSSNTVGDGFNLNTVGCGCVGNTFGNKCIGNAIGEYIIWSTVFDGVKYCDVIGGGTKAPLQNVQILNGTSGSQGNLLTITFTYFSATYTQCAALTTLGTLKIWNPADLVP